MGKEEIYIIIRIILWLERWIISKKRKISPCYHIENKSSVITPPEVDYCNLISEAVTVGYWELDHCFGENYVSDQVYQILGMNKETFANNIYSIIEKCFSPQDQETILRKMAQPKDISRENWFELNPLIDHEEDKWVRIKIYQIHNEENNLVKTIGIIQDITEFKNANHKINELFELKDAILEVNHIIIDVKNIIELFDIILDKVTHAMEKTDLACVLALDENKELKMITHKGYHLEEGQEFKIKLEDSFIWMKRRRKP